MSDQAIDVFDVIQFRTLRREICHGVRHGILDRSGIALKLDELYAYSVRRAVVAIEPYSAREIRSMKQWTLSVNARQGPMTGVEDSFIFSFVEAKLMAQDASLATVFVEKTHAAVIIQRNWRISVSNPEFKACRSRLLFECSELSSSVSALVL